MSCRVHAVCKGSVGGRETGRILLELFERHASSLTSGISFIRRALSSQIVIIRLKDAIAAIGTAFWAFISPLKYLEQGRWERRERSRISWARARGGGGRRRQRRRWRRYVRVVLQVALAEIILDLRLDRDLLGCQRGRERGS